VLLRVEILLSIYLNSGLFKSLATPILFIILRSLGSYSYVVKDELKQIAILLAFRLLLL
jgi:hypothetical protein